ncbi:hypothetical protein [Pacificibacter sp. AS14]|uniref:hypothetical protein n=1 Tax=Pacificibacter sp. AS14 TaxID=3135785 RepID=UPI0031780760
MQKPNRRELKVLREFAGTPEPWERFAGAGDSTLKSLLEAGWICENTDLNYPAEYYEITPAGESAAYQ